MSDRKASWFWVVGAASLAFVAGRGAQPEEVVRYRAVEVPRQVIIEREPDTVFTVVERIKYVHVPPIQLATAPRASVDAVADFCRPITVTQVETDTVYVEPSLLLRSVAVDDRMWSNASDVLFTGLRSDGTLVAADYKLAGDWSARTNGDSLIVRQKRGASFVGAVERLVPFGVGLLLGRVF